MLELASFQSSFLQRCWKRKNLNMGNFLQHHHTMCELCRRSPIIVPSLGMPDLELDQIESRAAEWTNQFSAPSLPFPSTFHANARGKEWNGMACPMATRPRYAISVGVGPTLIYVESFSIQFCGKPLSSPASDVASYLKETRVTVEE